MSKPRINTVNQSNNYESLQSLHVYSTIIEAGKPLTVRELVDLTGIADGTLYPLIHKRVDAGIIVAGKHSGTTEYDLTPEGYKKAKAALLKLDIGVATWLHADRKFLG